VRRRGVGSWRGIAQAIRWTFTTPAGWWFLAARLFAVTTAAWVKSQHGETPATVALVIAMIVAGLIAPPAPDSVDPERDPPGSAAAIP
jgi:hypothetical protein